MQKVAEQQLEEDMGIAERILSKTFGEKISLVRGEKDGLSERRHVHRLTVVQGPSQAPPSIIMKQARISEHHPYVPDESGGPASQFFNEWAGLQFLSEVCEDPLPSPRFYGGNRNAGIILMEDFGTGIRLDHVLRGNDAALAEKKRWLHFLRRSGGCMHNLLANKRDTTNYEAHWGQQIHL